MREYIARLAEKSLTKTQKAKRNGMVFTAGWIAAASFIVMAFSGCDNTFSVFQTISQEEKQIGADLFQNTTVRAMADDSSNYYALLGQVVWRPKSTASENSWNVFPINGSTDYFAAGLAGDGTNIYVAKADGDNVLDDIYVTSDGGTKWTAMNAATDIGSDVFVDWLKCANNTLFVAVHNSASKYSLFYYDGSSFVSAGAAVSGIDAPLVDILYDGSSSYWLVSDSKVYKGTTLGATRRFDGFQPDYDRYLLAIASAAPERHCSRREGYV